LGFQTSVFLFLDLFTSQKWKVSTLWFYKCSNCYKKLKRQLSIRSVCFRWNLNTVSKSRCPKQFAHESIKRAWRCSKRAISPVYRIGWWVRFASRKRGKTQLAMQILPSSNLSMSVSNYASCAKSLAEFYIPLL
jgi:hypothetical protein